MGTTFMLLAILGVSLASGFLRLSLGRWTVAVAVTLGLFTLFGEVGGWTLFFSWLVFGSIAAPLNHPLWRRNYVTKPALRIYRRMTPKLSETEEVALEAGTVGWEGELFAGKPDFSNLLRQPIPELSGRRKGVSGRPGGRSLPDGRRLEVHP